MAKDKLEPGALKGGPTKKMRCSCKHEYQDKKYGPGMRIHNKGTSRYTCTVCGATK